MSLDAADGEATDLGAEQRLQDVGELVGTNDGDANAGPPPNCTGTFDKATGTLSPKACATRYS